MTRGPLPRWGLVAGLVGALVLGTAGPASADTSTASATAATVTAGGSVASSGQVSSSNDGTTETTTGNTQPALTVLGGGSPVTGGVLAQRSAARTDGSSAACSGVVGSGGSVAVAADGSCVVTPGSGGLTVQLAGGATPVYLRADAVSARCTATSAGAVTGSASLVNARVTTVVPVALAANPAANTGVSVAGVAELVLNKQGTPSGTGSVGVTALTVTIGATGTVVRLAAVTCGANVVVFPTPVIPLTGWAFGSAVVLGGWALLARSWVRRRLGIGALPA